MKELIEAGKVRPVVDRTYPLAQAAEAIAYLESGKVRGQGRPHHLTRRYRSSRRVDWAGGRG